jgi:hypothetical protein
MWYSCFYFPFQILESGLEHALKCYVPSSRVSRGASFQFINIHGRRRGPGPVKPNEAPKLGFSAEKETLAHLTIHEPISESALYPYPHFYVRNIYTKQCLPTHSLTRASRRPAGR